MEGIGISDIDVTLPSSATEAFCTIFILAFTMVWSCVFLATSKSWRKGLERVDHTELGSGRLAQLLLEPRYVEPQLKFVKSCTFCFAEIQYARSAFCGNDDE